MEGASEMEEQEVLEPKFESVRQPIKRDDNVVLRRYEKHDEMAPIIAMMERDLSGECVCGAARLARVF